VNSLKNRKSPPTTFFSQERIFKIRACFDVSGFLSLFRLLTSLKLTFFHDSHQQQPIPKGLPKIEDIVAFYQKSAPKKLPAKIAAAQESDSDDSEDDSEDETPAAKTNGKAPVTNGKAIVNGNGKKAESSSEEDSSEDEKPAAKKPAAPVKPAAKAPAKKEESSEDDSSEEEEEVKKPQVGKTRFNHKMRGILGIF
jgi:hypothetical protein